MSVAVSVVQVRSRLKIWETKKGEIMNNRRFESVEVSAVIGLLKEALEHKIVFSNTREIEMTMQWEQEWHMQSLSPIIDAIDPYYNGYNDDGTIADCWYTAENQENSVQRRGAILDSLMQKKTRQCQVWSIIYPAPPACCRLCLI